MQSRATGVFMALALSAAIVAAGCGSDDKGGATTPAAFSVAPGVQQVTVTGADPKQALTLIDSGGRRLITLIADDLGQANFAYVPAEHIVYETGSGDLPPTARGQTLKPGDGYVIRDETKNPMPASEPFTVLSREDHASDSFYTSQELHGVPWQVLGSPMPGREAAEGVNYLEMRDGTKLSAMIRFPDPRLYGDGPYPTVIEYSGYDPSNPDSPQPGTMIANAFGFATVGLNMRGTGCSGGVFEVFNPAQQADGYDAVEIVAAQPWVRNGVVGMVGLSYSGISQLYVASTNPPHLAGITSLSVIEDSWQMSWPGGVYNAGFTKQWLLERERQSSPNGQPWVRKRIESGDTTCETNLDLRGQNVNFEAFVRSLNRRPADADERDLSLLVRDIQVPVFLTGAWQDEQTGPRFATMLKDFANQENKHFVVFNGHHPDGYQAYHLSRWFEFLSLYVGKQVPRVNPLVRAGLPAEMQSNFGVPLELEPDRFADLADSDYAAALERYEADPRVHVLFESGAGRPDTLGAPVHRFDAGFDSFPPPGVVPWRTYLDAGEALAASAPSGSGADAFGFDPAAGPIGYASANAYDFIKPTIPIDWTQTPDGLGLSYLTPPLDETKVVAGPGYVDLWLNTDEAEAPLEVVLSEVTPEGNEVRVQNGILAAGYRHVDETRSDEFLVRILFGEDDYEAVPSGEWVLVKLPIFPVAHAFRAGSRLRLQVNTPGRDLPLWFFDNPVPSRPDALYRIGRGGAHASSLVLPVLPAGAVEVPNPVPPCGSLRGQPCRPFVPTTNSAG